MKIRAAVLDNMGASPPYATSRPLSIVSVDLALPGCGEVLIKIAAAGPVPLRPVGDQWGQAAPDADGAGP